MSSLYGLGQTMQAYEPSWRDKLAAFMMGDGRASPERRRVVEGLTGSTGLGTTAASVADVTPAGSLFALQEAAKKGDSHEMSLAALGMLPGVGAVERGGAKFINNGAGSFSIHVGGKEIGRADVANDGLANYLSNVRIDPAFQRKGFGSSLYDFIEQEIGRNLRPSPTYQTDAAKAFWASRLSGVGAAERGAKGIIAYHGSPHSFDRFSLSKIGTGEGAQAYGHGLYFAENEDVARAYRDQLKPVPSERNAQPHLMAAAKSFIESGIAPEETVSAMRQVYKNASDEQLKLAVREVSPGFDPWSGHMYQVRINADPAQFLDWDKPFQNMDELEGFAAKFDGVNPTIRRQIEDWGYERHQRGHRMPDGSDLVRQVFGGIEGSAARQGNRDMLAAGVPGIKYLDSGSRGAGEGSRNYVVFNDQLIDILKKYGIAAGLAPLGAGAFMSQDAQPAL